MHIVNIEPVGQYLIDQYSVSPRSQYIMIPHTLLFSVMFIMMDGRRIRGRDVVHGRRLLVRDVPHGRRVHNM